MWEVQDEVFCNFAVFHCQQQAATWVGCTIAVGDVFKVKCACGCGRLLLLVYWMDACMYVVHLAAASITGPPQYTVFRNPVLGSAKPSCLNMYVYIGDPANEPAVPGVAAM